MVHCLICCCFFTDNFYWFEQRLSTLCSVEPRELERFVRVLKRSKRNELRNPRQSINIEMSPRLKYFL